jgi:hypothetical protein
MNTVKTKALESTRLVVDLESTWSRLLGLFMNATSADMSLGETTHASVLPAVTSEIVSLSFLPEQGPNWPEITQMDSFTGQMGRLHVGTWD